MALKKNTQTTVNEAEKLSSSGYGNVPDPVVTNAKRPADQENGQSFDSVKFKTQDGFSKADTLQAIMARFTNYSREDLNKVFKALDIPNAPKRPLDKNEVDQDSYDTQGTSPAPINAYLGPLNPHLYGDNISNNAQGKIVKGSNPKSNSTVYGSVRTEEAVPMPNLEGPAKGGQVKSKKVSGPVDKDGQADYDVQGTKPSDAAAEGDLPLSPAKRTVKGEKLSQNAIDGNISKIGTNPRSNSCVSGSVKITKEDLDDMGLSDLDEDLAFKTQTIFEAHLNTRLMIENERLHEEYQELFEETVGQIQSDLVDSIDKYLNRVVENWLEQNQVAVEEGLKTEITKDFITGLRGLFQEHNINVPEEELDVIKTYEEKLAEIEYLYNEEVEKNIALKENLVAFEVSEAFDEACDGLAMTQAEKLRSLVENIEYSTVEEFKAKVEILKENAFGGSSKKSSSQVLAEDMTEVDDGEAETTETKYVAPEINEYVAAISRSIKR